MNIEAELIQILKATLHLDAAGPVLDASTPLLGSLPELDSMAVVAILTAIEERFAFAVDDDEVDGRTFESIGSLTAFVQAKLQH